MTDFRKKLPIELDHTFACYISYRYSKESHLFIVPKKYSGVSKVEEKETYWLSEEHAIVNDDFIVYRNDYISRDDFDWKPASDMRKGVARYGVECHKIDTKKLKAVTKSEIIKSGVPNESFFSKDDEGITSDFENRPREFWRFKKRWEEQFGSEVEWDDGAEVLIFHFQIHRFDPELPVFDWSIEEKLNQKKREMERQAIFEKEAENEKKGRKKKTNKKTGGKKLRKR